MPAKKKKYTLQRSTFFKPGHSLKRKSLFSEEIPCIPSKVTRHTSSMENQYFIIHMHSFNKLLAQLRDHTFENNCNLVVEKISQRLVSSTWRLRCLGCQFKTNPEKLYFDNNHTQQSQKSNGERLQSTSTLNMSIGAALLNSSIGATQFREIFLCLGINPGSLNAIMQVIDKVGQITEELARKNMADVRTDMKRMKNVTCSIDACYNNKNHYGKSPYQPATQSIYTVIATDEKNQHKIVYSETQNKLCMVGSRRRARGLSVQCPNHTNCTANLSENEPISNEGKVTEACLDLFAEEGVKIKALCSDGDTKIGKILNKKKYNIQHMKDRAHFARNLRKKINGLPLSKDAFKTKTKKMKQQKQRWFSMDITKRMEAEFTRALYLTKSITDDDDKKEKNDSNLKKRPSRCPVMPHK